ncbi:MAG: cytochrome C [Nitrospiraceae bacterium]|nr:MAG: cytochrome C [Nitrospiraceae bacterium]
MGTRKVYTALIALFAMILLPATDSRAFHSGGVAECTGCHHIHDASSSSSLLTGTDISSTCLNCHGASGASSYRISTPDADMPAGTPPGNRTPGGDFGWLKKTYTYSPRTGTTSVEAGEMHGHNIVAADFGYVADSRNTTAPGGNMDSAQLSCNSCHDNHGRLRRTGTDAAPVFGITGAPIIGSGSYKNSSVPAAGQAVGAYRLLRGSTLQGAGSGGKTFNVVFNAVAPATYNRSEATTHTRVAYGRGISDWCATCHPDMHTATSSKMTHPVNQMLATVVTNIYNKYRGSGNATGTTATAYDSIVPFQSDNLINYTTLKAQASDDGSVKSGPVGSDRVMCLSCHRAHASGWEYMTRWNATGNEFIAVDGVWPGTDSPSTVASQAKYAQGRTVAETTKAYNDKTMVYASYQRSLCNKCHAKD